MRVVVTGGGGFIGSHVAELLTARGHECVVLDRAPAHPPSECRLVVSDLNDPGVAERAVEGAEAVVHLAARVGMGRGFDDAPDYYLDNVSGTAVLLRALSAAGFAGRLVLSSSMVVYGEGRYRCVEHGEVQPEARSEDDLAHGRFEPRCPACGSALRWASVPEQAPLDPRSVYAATKVAQEQLCRIWAREAGASVVALRYHNVYGPRLPLDTPYAGVAAIFRTSLQRGEAPAVFEDGGQLRDFVHVRDVAIANASALDAVAGSGTFEAINVCSGTPVTIGDVAGAMADAFGPGAPRPVVTGRYRLGDVRHVVADPSLAEARLGFRASVALADGVMDLVSDGT